MSHISVGPLSPDQSALLASLFNLGVSGTNQGIAKLTTTTFGNVTFSGSSGGGTWGSITGTLSAQTDLQSALDAKQATLVSGTTIKTINSTSLLGSGNISVATSPLTTKGDIWTYSTLDARLAVGGNGQVLSADSSAATGLKWIDVAGTGDMTKAVYDPANIAEQLVGLVASQTLSNKTFVAPALGTPASGVATNLTGTATALNIGGNAATITVADEAADTTCFIGFYTAASGSLGGKTNANLTFNSNTGVLTLGQTAVGSISGTAGVATTVTTADEATDTTCFITFATAATGNLGIKTNANMTFNSNTGVATFASTVLTTTDINGGTVDGTVIGASSAAAATITTLIITSFGGNWTNAGRTVADGGIFTTLDLNGGTVDGTVIGGSSAAAGTFTTIVGNSVAVNNTTVPAEGIYRPTGAGNLGFSVSGAAELLLTSTAFSPAADGGNSLGTTALGWQNLFANTGFVLNIENSDWVATHTAGILTVGTGDLRVTNNFTNATSVVTIGGAQTLTNKTLTSPTLTSPVLGTPSSGTGTNITGIPAANILAGSFGAGAYVISTSLQVATLELGAATDTTLARVSAGIISVEGVNVVTISSTDTLTNKRRTRRVTTTAQSATPTINTDNMDVSSITGLAQAITSFTTNLSGTPVAGDLLEIQITDDGTGRAITWGTSFASSGNVSLPTTTVASTMLRVGLEWNTATSKWVCIALA